MRVPLILVLCVALMAPGACGGDECKTNADCPTGRICRLGLCALDLTAPDTLIPDGTDINVDCEPAAPGDLVLNEILADPPPGHDINGDGVASATGDEFVEIVNVSTREVGLLNVKVQVNARAVVAGVFCLAPNQAQVIFGADGLPTLANAGATVSLLIDEAVVQTHTYGSEGGRDQSMTLAVQLDPESGWVLHTTLSDAEYSPGKCANGNDFPNCAGPGPVEQDPDVVNGTDVVAACSDLPVVGDLLINEILADPGAELDANQDGTANSQDDEFVEVVNVSAKTLLVTGVTISEAGGQTFTFPANTCLAPGQAAVLFSRYEEGGDFGGALVFSHGRHLALNNAGDTVTLKDGAGESLDQVVYGGATFTPRQSLVREIDGDITAAFIRHANAATSGGAPMSPGRCTSGTAFPDCSAPPAEVVEEMPDTFIGDTLADTAVADTAPSEVIDDVGPVDPGLPIAAVWCFEGDTLAVTTQDGITAATFTWSAGGEFVGGNMASGLVPPPGCVVTGSRAATNTGWGQGSEPDFVAGKYFELSFVTPSAGVVVIELDARRSNTGPTHVQPYHVGSAAAVGAPWLIPTTFTAAGPMFATPEVAVGGGAHAFRFYGYNASGGTGTLPVDNVVVRFAPAEAGN